MLIEPRIFITYKCMGIENPLELAQKLRSLLQRSATSLQEHIFLNSAFGYDRRDRPHQHIVASAFVPLHLDEEGLEIRKFEIEKIEDAAKYLYSKSSLKPFHHEHLPCPLLDSTILCPALRPSCRKHGCRFDRRDSFSWPFEELARGYRSLVCTVPS